MNDDDKAAKPGEALPSEDEERAASRLREALADGSDAMVAALGAALRPADLDHELHERILARALRSDLGVEATKAASNESLVPAATASEPPPNEREQQAAAALGQLFEQAERSPRTLPEHALVSLAYALKHAHAPQRIDDLRNEALLRPALRLPSRSANRRLVLGSFAFAVALAAGVLGVFVGKPAFFGRQTSAPAAQAPVAPTLDGAFQPGMVEVHSTSELFQEEDFPRTGGTTRRIDRISNARQADLRKNRFVQWGVP